MKFKATVIPSGNATAVEIPAAVMRALGPQGRPPIAISPVAAMRGLHLRGPAAPDRQAGRDALRRRMIVREENRACP
jgi:hypothetical protein